MTLLKSMKYDAQNPALIERFIHLVSERRCHSLLMDVEKSKIDLSDATATQSDLGWIEKGLVIGLTREDFEKDAHGHLARLQKALGHCLTDAGLEAAHIDVIFFTGGSSMIPAVRSIIMHSLPGAEIVNGDQFGAVGLGLGIEAGNRYG